MKEQLKNDLLEYLGELKNDREHEFGYWDTIKTDVKIEAVNMLLDFTKERRKNAIKQAVNEVLKTNL